ncbi:MAG TPA: malate dehydrogenase [Proteobacteria bacterium]|nr:malate dehydrogenase [Pseudomonadota bacterium]
MARKKVTIVGAGNVGATLMHWLVARGICDIVLVDVVEGLPQGKALDMFEATPALGMDVKLAGANDYEPTAGSDVIVLTAGLPRKPGMSRDELLDRNAEIAEACAKSAGELSPDAFWVIVSNPLDAICYVVKHTLGLPKNRIVGMAGMLDSARFALFVAMKLGVSVRDVRAIVLGGHGDQMVPMPRLCTVGGLPLTDLMSKDEIDAIIQRTRDAGAEIVKLLKFGSAYYSPALCTAQMVEAILLDQKRVVPCAAYLEGEYGFSDMFLGVPVLLGGGGVEKVFEIELEGSEKELLANSANAVKSLIETWKRMRGISR